MYSQKDIALNSATDFINTGTVQAGSNMAASAQQITNNGNLYSRKNLTLDSATDLLNTGEIYANGDLSITANTIQNQQDGILSGRTHTQSTQHLINRGVIDSSLVRLEATTLDNMGTGRIYGDHLSIQSTTLNNRDEAGGAATIAARERLDLGVSTLKNQEQSLIFSGGDMTIGGAIDQNGQAVGSAEFIGNHSASIESLGKMSINAQELQNTNEHLKVAVEVISKDKVSEIRLADQSILHDLSDVTFTKNKYGVRSAITASGSSSKHYQYDYTRTIKESVVKETAPARIVSGEDMTLNIGRLLNRDSQIMAGGTLTANIDQLDNIETKGKQVITDVGTMTYYYAKKKKKKLGGTKTSQGKDKSSYRPAVTNNEISLGQFAFEGNTAINIEGSPTLLTEHEGVKAPTSSLFTVHPESDAHYLIETDKRFTAYKEWLSSDYFFDQLKLDPNYMQKRLGDGFYEQKLIREQISQLTGKRFLEGYGNDEAQYRALIDSGIAVGKSWNLTPGIALTAAQMSQLTSDIVWMVEEKVVLPDGSTTTALVPKVYAASTRPSDPQSLALISGKDLSLNVSGQLVNQGSLVAAGTLLASAQNITNQGNISGTDVYLEASQNINHQAGIIQGQNSVTLRAGHDHPKPEQPNCL